MGYRVIARYQLLGGHSINRGGGTGVHSYTNLKILGSSLAQCAKMFSLHMCILATPYLAAP